jgi:hypothetical protein
LWLAACGLPPALAQIFTTFVIRNLNSNGLSGPVAFQSLKSAPLHVGQPQLLIPDGPRRFGRLGEGVIHRRDNLPDRRVGDAQLSSVVGLAGAGKSTLLATAKDAWDRQDIKVHGAALAGKAAEELQSASGITSRTLFAKFSDEEAARNFF